HEPSRPRDRTAGSRRGAGQSIRDPCRAHLAAAKTQNRCRRIALKSGRTSKRQRPRKAFDWVAERWSSPKPLPHRALGELMLARGFRTLDERSPCRAEILVGRPDAGLDLAPDFRLLVEPALLAALVILSDIERALLMKQVRAQSLTKLDVEARGLEVPRPADLGLKKLALRFAGCLLGLLGSGSRLEQTRFDRPLSGAFNLLQLQGHPLLCSGPLHAHAPTTVR